MSASIQVASTPPRDSPPPKLDRAQSNVHPMKSSHTLLNDAILRDLIATTSSGVSVHQPASASGSSCACTCQLPAPLRSLGSLCLFHVKVVTESVQALFDCRPQLEQRTEAVRFLKCRMR